MKYLRVEPLSRKFSIVKDNLWCIYDGQRPLFQGTMDECRVWLDYNEARALPFDNPARSPSMDPSTEPIPPVTIWDRMFQFMFGTSPMGTRRSLDEH